MHVITVVSMAGNGYVALENDANENMQIAEGKSLKGGDAAAMMEGHEESGAARRTWRAW